MSHRIVVELPNVENRDLLAEIYRLDHAEHVDDRLRGKLAVRISTVFDRAFYPSGVPHRGWSVESVSEHLARVDLVIMVRSKGKADDVAYAVFSKAECTGRSVLFVESMGVAGPPTNQQGKGIGKWLLRRALEQLPSEVVAARTQHPAMVQVLWGSEPDELLPKADGYPDADRDLLASIVRRFGPEWADRVDLSTGVCPRAYGSSRLGEYTVDRGNPSVDQIEFRLQNLGRRGGFQRDRGDAVVIVAKGVESRPASPCAGRTR